VQRRSSGTKYTATCPLFPLPVPSSLNIPVPMPSPKNVWRVTLRIVVKQTQHELGGFSKVLVAFETSVATIWKMLQRRTFFQQK